MIGIFYFVEIAQLFEVVQTEKSEEYTKATTYLRVENDGGKGRTQE